MGRKSMGLLAGTLEKMLIEMSITKQRNVICKINPAIFSKKTRMPVINIATERISHGTHAKTARPASLFRQ